MDMHLGAAAPCLELKPSPPSFPASSFSADCCPTRHPRPCRPPHLAFSASVCPPTLPVRPCCTVLCKGHTASQTARGRRRITPASLLLRKAKIELQIEYYLFPPDTQAASQNPCHFGLAQVSLSCPLPGPHLQIIAFVAFVAYNQLSPLYQHTRLHTRFRSSFFLFYFPRRLI
ncbi:hypothetical protein K504DRAFT_41526 [Pleomassaria siparia CBS 279.74]|uniref:Uncharacterized protein n=1 Tax=Pleomassaria siparia CBS 279.74 TaxID=1314801 RepID=A0A6G1K592_9PLEO|nr:hypothetical protein K504DRAFT_41526 [Pleomassaria siparia CBS 279.74]